MSFPVLSNKSATGSLARLHDIKIRVDVDYHLTKQIIEEWYILSQADPTPVTRFLVAEQGHNTRPIYCVACRGFVKSKTFLLHNCAAGPVVLCVEFRITLAKQFARLQDAIQTIAEIARERPSYMAFWNALTLHAASLFNAGCIDLDLFADLRLLHVLHPACLDSVGDQIHSGVAHITSQAAESRGPVAFRERRVPHILIIFQHEEEAAKAVYDWYLRVQCAAVPGRDAILSYEATTLRLEDQKVDGTGAASYYCTKCSRASSHKTWPKHICRSVVSVTFKRAALSPGLADSLHALSWVKRRAITSTGFLEMWKVLTKHCAQLYEFNMLTRSAMQNLLVKELLIQELLDPEMVSDVWSPGGRVRS